MRVFRLVHAAYAKAPLDGEGAFRYGGRWNSPGVRVAYLSNSPSLAQLEYLAGVGREQVAALGPRLSLIVAVIPRAATIGMVEDEDLPKNWRAFPAPASTQAIGDAWLAGGRSLALSVPSVFLPLAVQQDRNILINPAHASFKDIDVEDRIPFAYESRLH